MNNYNAILHKRNSSPGATPALTSLSAGEIAMNDTDGVLFIRSGTNVKQFLDSTQMPFTLDSSLSSVNFQYGENTVTGILAGVLGGIDNDVSGAGSTVVNGSDNDIEADYSFIGNGSNNTILSGGDFGAILGGQNNTLDHQESFIIGSNITSHLSGVTYVNNLSATGKIYGDGSELQGIVAGDSEATTLVRSNSAKWESTYTDFSSNSASYATESFVSTNFLPLSGGTISGPLSTASITATEIVITVNPAEASVLYVSDEAKVGINTDEPNVALTVVGDVSATGKVYGDGSELSGIVPGDTEATTLVRSNSADWQGTYTTVQTSSADWQNTYTTVLANSASWESTPVILNSDPLKFVFIGDGSTTSYTVSGTAGSENASLIEVFVENVRQEPVESYTLSAEVVEFTVAPELSSRIVIITPNVTEGQGGGGGDESVNTLVRSNSAEWDEAYTLVQTNSGSWSPERRHDFVEETDYTISYAGLAPSGAAESSALWTITKLTYTTSGSISATQYAESAIWNDRLTVEYT